MAENGGSSPAAGGAASGGGVTMGAAGEPVSSQGGDAGAGGEPECPVTPATGKWVSVRPDPYGFELTSDGTHLSGVGCLAALPSEEGAMFCTPLSFEQDRGRHVGFVWDMTKAKEASSLAYLVRTEMTLSPERTAMAGRIWTSVYSNGEPMDIVLVRAPGQSVPDATACSGGQPSGACFLRPLNTDRIDDLRVVELGGGSLLLQWTNRRGDGNRLASARFDGVTGAWQEAEFLDDGSAPVTAWLSAANPQGYAMAAYRQNDVILTRAYDPKRKAWSKQRAVPGDPALSHPNPEKLLVYDGGDATLLVYSQTPVSKAALSAVDYVAKQDTWTASHDLVVSGDVDASDWAAASNSARDQLVTWVEGDVISEPFEVWFSSRRAGESWTAPAKLFTGDKQIVDTAVAVDESGNAIVTWHEWITRLASSSYSFASGTWSAPLTITPLMSVDNGTVAYEAGTPVAYFLNREGLEIYERAELVNDAWSAPVAIPFEEANGARYSMAASGDDFTVTPLHLAAGQASPPALSRPRCEGY